MEETCKHEIMCEIHVSEFRTILQGYLLGDNRFYTFGFVLINQYIFIGNYIFQPFGLTLGPRGLNATHSTVK